MTEDTKPNRPARSDLELAILAKAVEDGFALSTLEDEETVLSLAKSLQGLFGSPQDINRYGPNLLEFQKWLGRDSIYWITLPRAIVQQMGEEWLGEFLSLMGDLENAFPSLPLLYTRVLFMEDNRTIATPAWVSRVNPNHPHPALTFFRSPPVLPMQLVSEEPPPPPVVDDSEEAEK